MATTLTHKNHVPPAQGTAMSAALRQRHCHISPALLQCPPSPLQLPPPPVQMNRLALHLPRLLACDCIAATRHLQNPGPAGSGLLRLPPGQPGSAHPPAPPPSSNFRCRTGTFRRCAAMHVCQTPLVRSSTHCEPAPPAGGAGTCHPAASTGPCMRSAAHAWAEGGLPVAKLTPALASGAQPLLRFDLCCAAGVAEVHDHRLEARAGGALAGGVDLCVERQRGRREVHKRH